VHGKLPSTLPEMQLGEGEVADECGIGFSKREQANLQAPKGFSPTVHDPQQLMSAMLSKLPWRGTKTSTTTRFDATSLFFNFRTDESVGVHRSASMKEIVTQVTKLPTHVSHTSILNSSSMIKIDVNDATPTSNSGSYTLEQKVYRLLEVPESSVTARILSYVTALMALASVLILLVLPVIDRVAHTDIDGPVGWWSSCVFSIYFTIELVLRFAVANAFGPKKRRFILDPFNVCDFLAILPWYIELLTESTREFYLLRSVRLFRLMRIVRVNRIFKSGALLPPVSMVLIVIWFIFLKNEQ